MSLLVLRKREVQAAGSRLLGFTPSRARKPLTSSQNPKLPLQAGRAATLQRNR